MKTCIACGMPLEGEHAKDFGMDLPEGPVCRFDIKDGALKDPADIYEGGVMFFLTVANNDKSLAERLTRRNMKSLPHWQAHPFSLLDGAEATDAEWAEAMGKF